MQERYQNLPSSFKTCPPELIFQISFVYLEIGTEILTLIMQR
nr:MAG TPA: hypothetical protein [Caudoviricetes sp.]